MKTWPVLKTTVTLFAILYTGVSLAGRLRATPPAAAPTAAEAPQAAAPAKAAGDRITNDDFKVSVEGDNNLQAVQICVRSERPVTITKVTINGEFSPTRQFIGWQWGKAVEGDDEYTPHPVKMGDMVGFVFWGNKKNQPYLVKRDGPNYDKQVVKVDSETDRGNLTYKL